MEGRINSFSWLKPGRWSLLALLLCFLLAEGCSQPQRRRRARRTQPQPVVNNQENNQPEAVDPVVSEPVQPETTPDPIVNNVDDTPKPQPRTVRPANTQDGMTSDRLLEILTLDSDSRKREAQRMIQMAHEDRLNFETLKAEAKLEMALKIDPENEEAERLLSQIRTELGDYRGEVYDRRKELIEAKRATESLILTEIHMMINKGQGFVDRQDFDRAIGEYQKGLEMIRHNALNLNLSEEEQIIQNKLQIAQDLKVQKDEEDRREQELQIARDKEAQQSQNIRFIKNRIAQLRARAQEAYDRKDYEVAADNYDQILRANPGDVEALTMRRISKENHSIQERHRLFKAQVENQQLAILAVEESSLLYKEILTFPDREVWEEMAPKDISLADKVALAETEVDKEIKRKLQEPQDIQFPADTPFKEALRSLQQISSLNFVISSEADSVLEDAVVELPRTSNIPLANLLNILLSQVEDESLGFTVARGAVNIGTKSELANEDLILHFYDIHDITQDHPDFPAPPLALESLEGQSSDEGFGGDFGLDDEGDSGDGKVGSDKLVELVEKELTSEDEDVQGSVNFERGKLAVQTTYENHQKVERLLAELRKASGIMVTVESRFLALQDNYLEEIGIDIGNGTSTFLPTSIPDIDGSGTSVAPGYEFLNAQQDWNLRAASIGGFSNPIGSRVNPFNITPSGGTAYQLNVLTDQYQLEALLTGVAKDQEIRSLSSPRVTAFNTQIAHTMVVNQAAYIKDLEVNQTGVVPVINPRIGVLNSGSILEVRPNVSHDRKYIILEIQPTLAERLDSEIAVLNLSGNLTVVPVELPVTSVTQIRTTVTVPDGGTVLVGGLKREINAKQKVGIPGIANIPVLNLVLGRKGNSTLRSNLFVLINAKITVVQEVESRLFNS